MSDSADRTENPFTTKLPTLQRAWDATSLNALQFCPRYYQQSILQGYRERGNNDLEFGGYFASAVEVYKKARLQPVSKEQATLRALHYAIEATYDRDTGPWSGVYETAWRCTGTEPYRNAKGNRAKCPWSHKGEWFPEPAPDVCGSCGSPIQTERRWVPCCTKDRYTLVRLVATYCDNQPETSAEGAFPISFSDATPAVELSFRYPLERHTPDGEPYIACGHIDSIMQFGGENFIDDNKTTTKTLNAKFWATFSPNTQVDLYDLTGSVLWPSLDIQGVLIEGAQITKTMGTQLGVGIMRRTDEQRNEFLRDLDYWLSQAELFAQTDYWPMNRRNCWLCAFKEVCAAPQDQRVALLDEKFDKRKWNPLEER